MCGVIVGSVFLGLHIVFFNVLQQASEVQELESSTLFINYITFKAILFTAAKQNVKT